MMVPDPDPYLPGHGDLSYTVDHYDLQLDYAVDSNHLSGHARLRLRALVDLDELTLDLHHLKVVKLGGCKVAKHTHRSGRLHVRLASTLRAGATADLVVTYRGVPKLVQDQVGDAGWEELTDGVIVAAQPGGAPSWFPCNDRPDAKASFRMTITTASEYFVVANGTRTSYRQHSSSSTWTYEQPEPMATYLATVQIGRYAEHEIGGPVPMTAAVPPARRSRFDAAFADQPRMMAFFIRLFGPYPFANYRVVLTDDDLEIPLEAQGLSIFGSNFLSRDWNVQRLIAHEMAHQWFGNAVTLRTLRDIWLHEGFACYSEWLWSQECGGPTTAEQAHAHWSRLSCLPQDLVLGNPGIDDVFDDRVYKRGALTLHAIRVVVGDDLFFGLLRAWIATHQGGNVTTRDFVEFADSFTGHPVHLIIDAWVNAAPLPPFPVLRNSRRSTG